MKDIINLSKKNVQKVVQKYIERPLLVNNRKFDIRQWVLVTSWEPLDAFVFETAYLKFCSCDYSLDEFSDVYRHLSNYSINKKNQDNAEGGHELIMSAEEFEEYQGESFSWNRDLLP